MAHVVMARSMPVVADVMLCPARHQWARWHKVSAKRTRSRATAAASNSSATQMTGKLMRRDDPAGREPPEKLVAMPLPSARNVWMVSGSICLVPAMHSRKVTPAFGHHMLSLNLQQELVAAMVCVDAAVNKMPLSAMCNCLGSPGAKIPLVSAGEVNLGCCFLRHPSLSVLLSRPLALPGEHIVRSIWDSARSLWDFARSLLDSARLGLDPSQPRLERVCGISNSALVSLQFAQGSHAA